jgi:hypothetical protein
LRPSSSGFKVEFGIFTTVQISIQYLLVGKAKPWSKVEDDKLWRLYQAKTALPEMSKHMGRTQASTQGRVKKLRTEREGS